MITKRFFIVSILLLCAVDEVHSAQNAINSVAEAIAQANVYLGFSISIENKEVSETISVDVIKITDTFTPFLADSISGRMSWKVKIKGHDMNAQVQIPNGKPIALIRDLEIDIDSATGQILMVVMRIPQSHPKYRLPKSNESEIILNYLQEKIVSLPDSQPITTLAEAFHACQSYVYSAKEVYASYVYYSVRDLPPQRVWVLFLREIPPLPMVEGVPEYQSTMARTLIDAITGQVLFQANAPFLMNPPYEIDDGLKADSTKQ